MEVIAEREQAVAAVVEIAETQAAIDGLGAFSSRRRAELTARLELDARKR